MAMAAPAAALPRAAARHPRARAARGEREPGAGGGLYRWEGIKRLGKPIPAARVEMR